MKLLASSGASRRAAYQGCQGIVVERKLKGLFCAGANHRLLDGTHP
jgi:hypothetical protein